MCGHSFSSLCCSVHVAIINSHKEHKCPCVRQTLCTRTKSQSMHLVLLQINTASKVAPLWCTFFKDELTHTLWSLENPFFFPPSLRLVFLCSRRQQNLPAVPGDTAELTVRAGVGENEMLLSCFSRRVSCCPAEVELLEETHPLMLHCIQKAQTGRVTLCCSPAAIRSSALCCTLLLWFSSIRKQAS